MYSTQPKLPFPQKKKASILKNTKDKMNQILSHDNSTKKMVLHPNEPITTVDEVSRSPRVTRSCSQLPQTPKSQRPNTCRTPTSHQPITPKTPSTLLSDLHLGSPRTPSSLLRSLKLDSPKRKIDTALEFASPKRVFKDADATSSGAASAVDATSTSDAVRSVSGSRSSASDVASRSRSSASDIASPRMKLFAEDKTSLQDSSSKRTRSRNDSPAKPVESPLKISDRLNLCLRRRDSSEANPVAISPLKRLVSSPAKKSDESPLKRSQGRSKSPLKTSSSAKDSPKRSQDKTPIKPNKGFGSSPLKRSQRLESPLKRNSVKLKSSADIENELFDSDLDDSPEKLDSPLKNSGIPLKNPSDNFASPRRSLRLTIDSPKKVGKFNLENISGAARSKNSPQIDRFNLENTAVATRSPLKIDSPRKISAYNSENTLRSPLKRDSSREISKYNSENASVTTRSPMKIDSPRKIDKHNLASIRSPLKTEADCLRPLSPIKNIILDKKSPFKAFIRDDEDLIKRSPAKLCSPRKLLFSEDKPKVEEKAKDSCELPGREVQLEGIRQFLLGHVNNETSGSMYISGPPGTGKSASLNLLVSRAEIKDAFKTIYINCNSVRNAASVYETIVNELKLKPGGKSERHQLGAILKYFDTKHKSILLILDEIDALESRKQTILYTIFEWPSIQGSKLVLVGVANALDLTDRMLPRLQANVTLQPTLMNFAPYSREQILEIISQKLKQTDKFNMFNASALQLLAGKVAAVSGDIRKAIDITNHLIDLTYDNVKENGEVTGIGLKEVLGVISSVYCTSQSLHCSKDEDSFPLQQKLALASLLLLKSRPNVKDVTLGKLHEVYRKVCTQRNLQPLEMSEFLSACCLLDARGVLKIAGKTKNRISKVSLQWDEQDVKEALRDKQLVSDILNDTSCV